jgi:amidohydrolase
VTTIDARAAVVGAVRDGAEQVLDLSHRIHAHPELGFEEFDAARWIGEALEAAGLTVQAGAAGLETALIATAGDGDLTVGICAEYDALPGIGHACGHNMIAASAVAAAAALRPLVDDLGITLKVFGTPAEENGGGKILMLEAGAFDGTDLAMMVHPSRDNTVEHHTLAIADLLVTYTGLQSHAAVAPEKGLNAADALLVAQVAIGLLRQQLPAGQKVHGVTTFGGEAPNVIPGRNDAHYYVRARTIGDLGTLRQKVERCFAAGALATGCEVTVEEASPTYSDFRNDDLLGRLFRRNAESLGREFPEAAARRAVESPGSTDMANVSLAIPAIHPTLALECGDAVNHQPEFAEWCAGPSADLTVLDAAQAMALTIVDVASDPAHRAEIRRRAAALRP